MAERPSGETVYECRKRTLVAAVLALLQRRLSLTLKDKLKAGLSGR
jgi:hypothetical protein